jgi:hypothetical protein
MISSGPEGTPELQTVPKMEHSFSLLRSNENQ